MEKIVAESTFLLEKYDIFIVLLEKTRTKKSKTDKTWMKIVIEIFFSKPWPIQLWANVYERSFCYRFATKESATHAIVAVHNSDINGQPVKCSWGKESGEPIVSQNASQVCSSQVSEQKGCFFNFFLNYHPFSKTNNLKDTIPFTTIV